MFFCVRARTLRLVSCAAIKTKNFVFYKKRYRVANKVANWFVCLLGRNKSHFTEELRASSKNLKGKRRGWCRTERRRRRSLWDLNFADGNAKEASKITLVQWNQFSVLLIFWGFLANLHSLQPDGFNYSIHFLKNINSERFKSARSKPWTGNMFV